MANDQIPFCYVSFRELYTYSCGRESMIWGAHPLASNANISTRVAQLAVPKAAAEGYKEQRSACILTRTTLFRLFLNNDLNEFVYDNNTFCVWRFF